MADGELSVCPGYPEHTAKTDPPRQTPFPNESVGKQWRKCCMTPSFLEDSKFTVIDGYSKVHCSEETSLCA